MTKDPVQIEKRELRPENFRIIRGFKDDCEFYEAHHRNGGWDHLQERDIGFRVMRNVVPVVGVSRERRLREVKMRPNIRAAEDIIV